MQVLHNASKNGKKEKMIGEIESKKVRELERSTKKGGERPGEGENKTVEEGSTWWK